MARRPDTPCAGCGKLLWGGRGALPAGLRRCNDCRRARSSVADSACLVCGEMCPPGRLTCSKVCARDARTRVRACTDCGAQTSRHPVSFGVFCEGCSLHRRRARQRRSDTRRRGVRKPKNRATIPMLGERDKWICHLCKKRVDRLKRWPDPRSASVDHLVPVAEGGSDEPDNLALSHLRCNVRRGTGGSVQLLLFG